MGTRRPTNTSLCAEMCRNHRRQTMKLHLLDPGSWDFSSLLSADPQSSKSSRVSEWPRLQMMPQADDRPPAQCYDRTGMARKKNCCSPSISILVEAAFHTLNVAVDESIDLLSFHVKHRVHVIIFSL